jgi:CRISPR system Cascade subunit CasD
MDCLILRFDAPLMSFGGVMVDQHNPTDMFPGVALLTGLAANALGWHHRDADRLDALQGRLRFAARWDVAPERLLDYHTVDLGQDFFCDTGWTTRGTREDRKGGSASQGTHIRYRHYLANGLATLAVTLADDADPDLAALEAALRAPARPLFLGRKACLPAAPILVERRTAATLKLALEAAPAIPGRTAEGRLLACWPVDEGREGGDVVEVFDRRDWRNQLHTGSRRMVHGHLRLSA